MITLLLVFFIFSSKWSFTNNNVQTIRQVGRLEEHPSWARYFWAWVPFVQNMPGLQLLFFILFFLIGNLEELLVIWLREQMPVHQRERLEKERQCHRQPTWLLDNVNKVKNEWNAGRSGQAVQLNATGCGTHAHTQDWHFHRHPFSLCYLSLLPLYFVNQIYFSLLSNHIFLCWPFIQTIINNKKKMNEKLLIFLNLFFNVMFIFYWVF